MSALSV